MKKGSASALPVPTTNLSPRQSGLTSPNHLCTLHTLWFWTCGILGQSLLNKHLILRYADTVSLPPFSAQQEFQSCTHTRRKPG